MKVGRITRVMKILTAMQSGRRYTVNELARTFGTSRRTVFRDLKELSAIGVPYRYDPAGGGYTIDPEFFLPTRPVTISNYRSSTRPLWQG